MRSTRTDDLPCTDHLDTRVTRRHHPAPPHVSRSLAYLLLACVFSSGMLGTTLPTPLYVLYQQQYQFATGLITVIFAVYALGVLAALLAFGRVSDHFGRRPVLLAALLVACASTLLFVFAQNVAMLLAGRVLSGLGTGLLTGTATAGLAELEPTGSQQRAARVAPAANMGGLGLGPLVAGLFAQLAPAPTQLVFVVYLLLLVVALLLVVVLPETVKAPDHVLDLQGYTAVLFDIDWSPDGTKIASASLDTVVSLWEVAGRGGGTPPKVLRGHGWTVYGVSWQPYGSVLASAGLDNAIRLWDPATGSCLEVIRDLDRPETLFWGLAWNPDGKLLAGATDRRGVLLWEVTGGSGRWIGRELPLWIRRVAFSPDGTRLVAGGDDGHVYVWNASDGTLLQRLAGHHGAVMSVAWSPDGSRLASAGGSELLVWEVHSGVGVRALAGHPSVASAVTWEPSGERLLSGGADGMLRWWDLHSGECVRVHQAHQGTVWALKVSPEGQRLASCGDDGAITLWDLERGEPLRTLRRDRPYERLNITGIRGLTEAEIATLRALGAMESTPVPGIQHAP